MKKIGIVVLNWNGYNDTVECINSLLNNSYKNKIIILLDNDSRNNEGIKLEKLFGDQITFVQNKDNLGFAGGCNVGIKIALEKACDYVMLFNNDAIAKNCFIEELLHVSEQSKKIGIVGPFINYYKSDKIWFGGGQIGLYTGINRHTFKGLDYKIFKESQNFETDYITGCCMLAKKDVFEKIGLLDEDYFAYYEEADFCWRANKYGYKIIVIPKSLIEHKKSASAGIKGKNQLSEVQAYLIARNGILFAKKNLRGIQQIINLFSQFAIKLPFNLLFNIRKYVVLKEYIKGIRKG